MSIFACSGTMRAERLPCLKYYNVLKWENRLTLGLNTAKNTNYMKKKLEIKIVENSIYYKKLSGRIFP